jgi:hypothetical protein
MTLVNSDDVDEGREPSAPTVPQIKIKPKKAPAAEKEPPHRPVMNVVTPVVTPLVWYNHVTPLLYHFEVV